MQEPTRQRETVGLDETPLHEACSLGLLDIVELLIRRQGSECLTVQNTVGRTPLDKLVFHEPINIPVGVTNSIRQHILQCYAGMIAQRDGPLCLHSVLQDAAFTAAAAAADDDDDDSSNIYEEKFQLSVGKLNTEYLQISLGIHHCCGTRLGARLGP